MGFLRNKYKELGYGHKAYVLYGSCTILAGLVAAVAVYGFDYSWRWERDFFLIVAGAWAGSIALIFFSMSSVERITESEFYRKSIKQGMGGSARWGGSGTFAKYEWRGGNAPIYLGKTISKYDVRPGGRHIGVDDEAHMLTIAQSGSGKSVTAIYPNLVKHPYPDSVFILDPKGEIAEETAHHRAAQGQRVVIFDPMQANRKGLKLSRFNPLAELQIDKSSIKEDILGIANACLVDEGGDDKSAHFSEVFLSIFSGLIAHIITTEPSGNHHLPRVYDLFKTLGGKAGNLELLEAMSNNHACGSLPSDSAMMLGAAGPNERGSIITTCLRNINWIGSEGMREHLMTSDFTLADLRNQIVSLYVILPFEKMDFRVLGRYMRILVYQAFKACRDTPLPASRAKRRTLFILDEVSMLGKMPELEKAYKTLRGSNVKVWSLYQQYSGLSGQVTDTDALTGNSTMQLFGCNDTVTAKKIEEYIGKYKYRDQSREIQRSLLDQTEILETLALDSLAQIIITANGDLMELQRVKCFPGETAKASVSNNGNQHQPREPKSSMVP